MFGLESLDVLIGLLTVYLVFGLACTAIVEAVAALLSMRSSNLESAMNEFLAGKLKNNDTFVKAFYDHPLVQSLSKGTNGRPSYIPPEVVGQVVESLVTAGSTKMSLSVAVEALPGKPEDNRIKGLLHTLVTQAGGDASAFREAVETHFNAAMERASGWYKRYAQNVALIVAGLLVIGANVDTVALANLLATSPTARVKMVDLAEQRLSEAKNTEEKAKVGEAEAGITITQAQKETQMARSNLDRAASEMASAGIELGWKDYPKTLTEILAKVTGLLVSIFAVSLGAPFWFDILQRFMQVRTTGKKLTDTTK